MKKILKVGFDMDGVILYNPIKFVRPIAKLLKPLKSLILKQNKDLFYYPKSRLEQFLFHLLHKTSFMSDPTLKDIKRLVAEKKIEAYIITGRYSFLEGDYEMWLKKINAQTIFKQCYQNSDDMQPNKFKEDTIRNLNLDIYVEDNWDIIQKLNSHTGAKIFWLTNILDRHIDYPYKFSNLKAAVEHIRTLVE